jgi:hypothetical protein
MRPARPPPATLALRDELTLEASITLREALARLESRRQTPTSAGIVGYDTTALVSTALELLQRAQDADEAARR